MYEALKALSVSALALSAFVSAGTVLADPRGLWLAQDGARVRVMSCDKAPCARPGVSEIVDLRAAAAAELMVKFARFRASSRA